MLHIPDKKNSYKDLEIETFSPSKILHLPLSVFGGDLDVIVQKGERVLKHQKLAEKEGVFGVNVHAPVSGHIGELFVANEELFLELFNDFLDEEIDAVTVLPTQISDLVQLLQNSGIEGSGGARFPTATKYNVTEGQINTLIVNGAECEPFLSADYALMKSYANEISQTLHFIQHLYKIQTIIIGIERMHKSLKPILEKAFKHFNVEGKIKLLPDFYPQGGELQLIKSTTGKELKKGTIPSKEGVLVSNVGTIIAMYNALFKGIPYIQRIVTLYDEHTNRGKNYWMPLGTTIAEISASFFPETSSPVSMIMGGPMMGKFIKDNRTSINKGSGGVIRMMKKLEEPVNCIACGYCVDVCPQNLLPMEFSKNVERKDTDNLKRFHLNDCIECGACAYICPSNIPLVNDIKTGKRMLV